MCNVGMLNIGRLALVVAVVAAGASSTATASEKGKQLFVRNGCWQCHGFVGQGGIAGPALRPNVMPLDAMSNFIRNSKRQMPPYSEAMLPSADLAEIHAYLTSVPAPADPKSVPLLNQ